MAMLEPQWTDPSTIFDVVQRIAVINKLEHVNIAAELLSRILAIRNVRELVSHIYQQQKTLSIFNSQKMETEWPKIAKYWTETWVSIKRIRGMVLQYRDDPRSSSSIMPNHMKNAFKIVHTAIKSTAAALVYLELQQRPSSIFKRSLQVLKARLYPKRCRKDIGRALEVFTEVRVLSCALLVDATTEKMYYASKSGVGMVLRRAVERKREALGELHPETLSSMFDLAIHHWELERWGEAIQLMEAVYRGELHVLGQAHRRTQSCRNILDYWHSVLDCSRRRARRSIWRRLFSHFLRISK